MTGGVAGFIQHALSRRTGRLGRAVHPRGVEVALEGESVAKRGSVGAQVVPPVEGQRIDVERADGLVKVAAAFGVVNQRHPTFRPLSKHLNGSLGGGQCDSMVVFHREQTGPRVEEKS